MSLSFNIQKLSAPQSKESGNQRIEKTFNGYRFIIGLPYLEKQKSGQWMATLHEAKFMGFSIIFITKSGRSNSVLDLIVEVNHEVLKNMKQG